MAKVIDVLPHVGLLLKLPFGCIGTVAITDLADVYKPKPLGAYSKNQLLRSVDCGTTGWMAHPARPTLARRRPE